MPPPTIGLRFGARTQAELMPPDVHAVAQYARQVNEGTPATTPPGGLPGLVPIVGWLRSYGRPWARGDPIAGVPVAALIVPKNLGYAAIAGVPVQNGLYAAAAGALLYGIFGTCR